MDFNADVVAAAAAAVPAPSTTLTTINEETVVVTDHSAANWQRNFMVKKVKKVVVLRARARQGGECEYLVCKER